MCSEGNGQSSTAHTRERARGGAKRNVQKRKSTRMQDGVERQIRFCFSLRGEGGGKSECATKKRQRQHAKAAKGCEKRERGACACACLLGRAEGERPKREDANKQQGGRSKAASHHSNKSKTTKKYIERTTVGRRRREGQGRRGGVIRG